MRETSHPPFGRVEFPKPADYVTLGRGRFAAFPPSAMRDAAEKFVRYRIASLAVPRQAGRESRTMFARDIREGCRPGSPPHAAGRPNRRTFLAQRAARPAERAGSDARRGGHSGTPGHLIGGFQLSLFFTLAESGYGHPDQLRAGARIEQVSCLYPLYCSSDS